MTIYFLATPAYSFFLKRVVLLDTLLLAIRYTLRIIAGASLIDEPPSFWLMAFSMFTFTSLAMAKRYAELQSLAQQSRWWVSGRGYHVDDLPIISQLGVTAGFTSVLVLALYIDSPDVADLYRDDSVMWLLCPLLMYWIGRIWLIANRGMLDQDPVLFATRDRVSYGVFFFSLVVLWAAV